MEIFLWLIVYLAFILPVTKCFAISSGTRLADCFVFGLFWPLFVLSVCLFEGLGWFVDKLAAKLVYLIED